MSARRDRVHPRATVRSLRCVVCGAAVPVQSATTPARGAPEMLQLPAAAWIGLVACDPRRDAARDPDVVELKRRGGLQLDRGSIAILTCSDTCLRSLLSE